MGNETRAIEFRGKPARICRPGEWLVGDLARWPDGSVAVGSVLSSGTVSEVVYPETISQFTGLFDKNGNRIFEGDIVRSPNGGIGAVFWDERNTRYWIKGGIYGPLSVAAALAVIGNIHDDPDMAEGIA